MQTVFHPDDDCLDVAGLNICQQATVFRAAAFRLAPSGRAHRVVDIPVGDFDTKPRGNLLAVFALPFDPQTLTLPIQGETKVGSYPADLRRRLLEANMCSSHGDSKPYVDHSMNYRSVMAIGRTRPVRDP